MDNTLSYPEAAWEAGRIALGSNDGASGCGEGRNSTGSLLPNVSRLPVPRRAGAVSGQPGPAGHSTELGVPGRRAVSGPDHGSARNGAFRMTRTRFAARR